MRRQEPMRLTNYIFVLVIIGLTGMPVALLRADETQEATVAEAAHQHRYHWMTAFGVAVAAAVAVFALGKDIFAPSFGAAHWDILGTPLALAPAPTLAACAAFMAAAVAGTLAWRRVRSKPVNRC